MDGWTERVTALLTESGSPVVLSAGETWGLPVILSRLRERGDFGWLRATPRLKNDPIAQGNAFAAALNDATGTRLFNLGLSAELHLQRLARYADVLPRFTLAITGAELSPQLIRLLLDEQPVKGQLLLEFTGTASLPEGVHPLSAEQFRLTAAEALELAPATLAEDAALDELRRVAGLRPAYLNRLSMLQGTQPELLPALSVSPEGEYHSSELVISALLRQKRFEDALELAVQAAPRRVDAIVRRAGPEFQRNGRLGRLHLLLSALDEPWSQLESTLEWRLVAAVDSGDHRDLLPEVDEFLAVHPAPDLRARRSALLSPERRQLLAREALSLARTPLTLWQAGRIDPDPDTAITLLQESVRLAEDTGSPYDIARNAGSLAEAYFHAGEFTQALHWSQWALSVMDEAGIGDVARRTRILNNLVISGILTGDTLGLQERLEDAAYLNLNGAPDVRANSRLTLATLAVAEDQPERAVELLEEASTGVSRRFLARSVLERVHILLAAGRHDEAVRTTEQAIAFSSGELGVISDNSELARLMLLALDGEDQALGPLNRLAADGSKPIITRLSAWLYTQLPGGGKTVPPEGLKGPLSQLALSGLKALSAPAERFEPLWRELLGGSARLQLQVLGEPKAVLDGRELRLTRRMWEVLTVIALNPQGIGDEQLLDFLVREGGQFGLSALRTHVSRLRGVVPVSDTPYTLQVSWQLDVQEVRRALSEGDLRRALRLFRGPLLPSSRTAGIEELRSDLEAELTEAVLASGDTEAVYALAERVAEDFRLWERAASLLPASDGRSAIAQARLNRLSRDYLN